VSSFFFIKTGCDFTQLESCSIVDNPPPLNDVYLRATVASPEVPSNMPDQEWVKTLEDGRKVKFIYRELPEDGAFSYREDRGE
jgi:hypothetical protein